MKSTLLGCLVLFCATAALAHQPSHDEEGIVATIQNFLEEQVAHFPGLEKLVEEEHRDHDHEDREQEEEDEFEEKREFYDGNKGGVASATIEDQEDEREEQEDGHLVVLKPKFHVYPMRMGPGPVIAGGREDKNHAHDRHHPHHPGHHDHPHPPHLGPQEEGDEHTLITPRDMPFLPWLAPLLSGGAPVVGQPPRLRGRLERREPADASSSENEPRANFFQDVFSMIGRKNPKTAEERRAPTASTVIMPHPFLGPDSHAFEGIKNEPAFEGELYEMERDVPAMLTRVFNVLGIFPTHNLTPGGQSRLRGSTQIIRIIPIDESTQHEGAESSTGPEQQDQPAFITKVVRLFGSQPLEGVAGSPSVSRGEQLQGVPTSEEKKYNDKIAEMQQDAGWVRSTSALQSLKASETKTGPEAPNHAKGFNFAGREMMIMYYVLGTSFLLSGLLYMTTRKSRQQRQRDEHFNTLHVPLFIKTS